MLLPHSHLLLFSEIHSDQFFPSLIYFRSHKSIQTRVYMHKRWLFLDRRRAVRSLIDSTNTDLVLRANEQSVSLSDQAITRIDISQLAANQPIEDYYRFFALNFPRIVVSFFLFEFQCRQMPRFELIFAWRV